MGKTRRPAAEATRPAVLERDSGEVRSEPRGPRQEGAAELKRAIAGLAGIRLKRPPKRFVSGISDLEELRYVFDRLVLSKNEAEFRGVLAEPFDAGWKHGHPGWTDPRERNAPEPAQGKEAAAAGG